MIQRYKLYSLLLAAPLLAASCSDDLDALSNGNEGNKEAINICAGINASNAGVVTRGWEDYNNGEYTAMTKNTKISLFTEGEWKKNSSDATTQIWKTSVATAGDAQTVAASTSDPVTNEKRYSPLTIAEATGSAKLYWDDFGTADPNNAETGRKNGLSMYAFAVNGVSDNNAPTITTETGSDNKTKVKVLSWDLGTTQSDATNGWSKKDLLISNNIQNPKNGITNSGDGRYTFTNRTEPANLIFTHAMSQITVNLYRGDGFTDNELASNNTAVSILNLQTTGSVNIYDGAISSLGTVSNISVAPHKDSYATDLSKVVANDATKGKFATYSALVMPTNKFENEKQVLKITVSGNTYYVTGAKMVTAAEPKAEGATTAPTSHTLKAGTNYIFNITISKTGLNITAQIADWKTYNAVNETPVLNVDADRVDTYTGTTKVMPANFNLYYSASPAKDYTTSKMFGNTSAPVEVKCTSKTEGTTTTYSYSFIEGGNDIKLYWPNHTTPYNFRGVVALNDADNSNIIETVTESNGISEIRYAESGAITRAASQKTYYPEVKADASNGDYVALTSGKDDKNNVLIGTHANTVDGNNTTGALATTGKVRLTFYHMMAHVTVLLRTTNGADKVTLGTAAVEADASKNIEKKDATWAEVKVLSYKKDGKVLLGSGAVSATTETPAEYTMPTITETYSATATDNFYSRASYMVPQTLVNDMKFQVTVTNEDGTTDTYTSVAINTIKVKTSSESGNGTAATSWEKGNKYIYTLTLKKTGLEVSAVLVPWVEYTGSTEVPFM